MTHFLVNTDGGSRGNPGPAGFGFVVTDDRGGVLLERAGFLGRATNNVAEYMAVVVALEEIAAADPSARVTVRADSKLVVEQLSGRWKIKNAELQQLALRAKRAIPPAQVRYSWVPRAENAAADALANRAMDTSAGVTRGRLPSSSDDDAHRSPDGATQPSSGATHPSSDGDAHPSSGDITSPRGDAELGGEPAVVGESDGRRGVEESGEDHPHRTPD
nr:reverse transcriptase-like protein [Actinomycetales bacterium]